MALPKISISFMNGQLGVVADSQDGLVALVCGAEAVEPSFALHTAYTLYRPSGLDALGVTEANNPGLCKVVREFYQEAPEGTRAVLFGAGKDESMASLCDKDSGPLRALLQGQKGELRGVAIALGAQDGGGEAPEGLDPGVFEALPKAQALAEWAAAELYAPIFVALEGRGFQGADSLRDLSDAAYDRVCIVIGDTAPSTGEAAMGTFAGRVAVSPVQRNIGRVRDGALYPPQMYIGAKPVEDSMDAVATIYDKGYAVPRTYTGRSGYYWADDRLCADPAGDYAHLANRRVVDKAARIAYDTLLGYMLDEILVNADGTMQQPVLKSWQAAVENAVNASMGANGELGGGEGESGCTCWIDPEQDVLATSEVRVTLRVRPFGYARQIAVELGFTVNG